MCIACEVGETERNGGMCPNEEAELKMKALMFEGRIMQINYKDGVITSMLLEGTSGGYRTEERVWFTITPPKKEYPPIAQNFSGPWAIFDKDQRPIVTIERDLDHR